MADSALRSGVKIVDPTTDANEAGVSAAGDLQVELGVALPAGANNIGDVDVLSLPNDEVDDDIVAGGSSASRVIGLTYAWDGVQWERVLSDGAGALDTTLTAEIPAGTQNIGDVDISSGPTGASALEVQGTAADGAAAVGDPVLVAGDDSANVQTLRTDTDGHLQVDVLSGGGTDSPTNPTIDTATSTDTAAGGGTDDLDSAEIAEVENLWMVAVSASVPFAFRIAIVADAVETIMTAKMFGRAGETVIFEAPHRTFFSHATAPNAGLDVFRVKFENWDNADAADGHASFFYST